MTRLKWMILALIFLLLTVSTADAGDLRLTIVYDNNPYNEQRII